MGRLFGTDGVRGLANRDVTAELAVDLSVAAAHVLATSGAFRSERPRAMVARDGRASGEFLSYAVSAGLASAGVDVIDVGALPTPALAYLVKSSGVELGVMVSASHNAMPDNGIKFFARGGNKLPDEVEDAIEGRLGEDWDRPLGADVGRIRSLPDAVGQYLRHLSSAIPTDLRGMKIVVDCAHGAASEAGPKALRAAGAEVIVIGASPDGLNINDGFGSTHLENLQEAVVRHGADIGVAFDGDADRCLAVNELGEIVDGDQIMGLLAVWLRDEGRLNDNTLVATVMSNLGLRLAMKEEGIRVISAAVGDRYVLEEMQRGGFNLGGEQSGHVVMLDHATTGDGILTALSLLASIKMSGRTASELASRIKRLPQVLLNVKDVDKARAAIDLEVQDAIAHAETELGDTGRVLLRPSGTEPLVRVMVEAADKGQAQEIAERLVDVVQRRASL
ncbi:phosphoglucosamine mutase [Micrococcales bacterium 31B]|nr:phosphoglucosamine mutase [Micrococcales bacterium 31B]